MITFTAGDYFVRLQQTDFPPLYAKYGKSALLVDEIDLDNRTDPLLCVIVTSLHDKNKARLVFAQHYNPGDDAAFYPGLCLIPETDILFIGAGRYVRVYNLKTAQKIADDDTEVGFRAWERHGNTVLMLAELGFASWDIAGKKLWTRFVEPPWEYSIENDTVRLDVMGKITRFPLATGDES